MVGTAPDASGALVGDSSGGVWETFGGLYWTECSSSVRTTSHSHCPLPASFLIKTLSGLLHKTPFETNTVHLTPFIYYQVEMVSEKRRPHILPHIPKSAQSTAPSWQGKRPWQHGMNGLGLRTVTSQSNEPPCPRRRSAHLRGQAGFKCKCTCFIYPE